jgi:anti-sigma factor RsiW
MRFDVSSQDPQEDRLSAYLDGELDPALAAELEARLAQDPDLAGALDAVSDVLVTLRGLDEVDPPAGYTERLRARLAEARQVPTEVAALADRSPRRRTWRGLGVAAAAALLGLVGGAVIRGGILRGPAPELSQAPFEAEIKRELAEDAGGPTVRLPALSTAPTSIVDAETPLANEAAVRAHLAELPEAKALLGTSVDQVPELADATRRAITAAPLFRSGAAPAACLDTIEQVGLVAHVESVLYQQKPALAYVVASASDGARTLDQVQVILVDPGTCTERLFITAKE